jgi:hypothetical protein
LEDAVDAPTASPTDIATVTPVPPANLDSEHITTRDDSPALADTVREINEAHERVMASASEALRAMRGGLEHARCAGQLLRALRPQFAYGTWIPWVKANCHFSTRTAQEYMQVAEHWPTFEARLNALPVAHLSYRAALALLAAESKERVPALTESAPQPSQVVSPDSDPADDLPLVGEERADETCHDDLSADQTPPADYPRQRAILSTNGQWDVFQRHERALRAVVGTSNLSDTVLKVFERAFQQWVEFSDDEVNHEDAARPQATV